MPKPKITTEEFDEAVRKIAAKDGVESILTIPGVWEVVAEHYNNDAIDWVLTERAEITERKADGYCYTCTKPEHDCCGNQPGCPCCDTNQSP